MNARTRWRTIAALLTSVAAIVFAGTAASGAHAQGLTSAQLAAQGWTCFTPPSVPNLVACFNPGLGRPIADTRPAYSVLLFSRLSGEFLNTAHLIRDDVYRSQPGRDDAYVFRPVIGYWECVHA